ncbi:hypothetical protein Tco_0791175 [Tanacetum coccineum]
MLRLLKILRKSMSKLVITIFKTDHNTGIKRILNNLQEVQNAVKGDHALNKKVLEVTTIDYLLATVTAQSDHLAKWAESSALMTWSVSPRMTRIKNTQDNIQSKIASLKIDTSKIKVMMTEIFCLTLSPTSLYVPSLDLMAYFVFFDHPRPPESEYYKSVMDKTQSTGFEMSILDQNKSKTSSEVELDTDSLNPTTVGDIQALLRDSVDEPKDDIDEEMLEAGEEMDEELL